MCTLLDDNWFDGISDIEILQLPRIECCHKIIPFKGINFDISNRVISDELFNNCRLSGIIDIDQVILSARYQYILVLPIDSMNGSRVQFLIANLMEWGDIKYWESTLDWCCNNEIVFIFIEFDITNS